MVTNGAKIVRSLGGDDLVCVTDPQRGSSASSFPEVDSGSGNDVVDASALRRSFTNVVLGAGSDEFLGSSLEESVYAGTFDPLDVDSTDVERDVLDGGGGPDVLVSGSTDDDQSPNDDTVLGGSGRDRLFVTGRPTPTSLTDGGSGSDSIEFDAHGGTWVVDAVAGTAHQDGVLVHGWRSVEDLSVYAGDIDLTYVGTPGSESLYLGGEDGHPVRATVDLGDGDDLLGQGAPILAGSTFAGGEGVDQLELIGNRVDADLAAGRLLLDGADIALTGMENLDAENSAKAVLKGDDGPNILLSGRGADLVDGRGGPDVITTGFGGDLIKGGGGNDELRGSEGRDRIVGNAGRDRAVGGRDGDTATPRSRSRASNEATGTHRRTPHHGNAGDADARIRHRRDLPRRGGDHRRTGRDDRATGPRAVTSSSPTTRSGSSPAVATTWCASPAARRAATTPS